VRGVVLVVAKLLETTGLPGVDERLLQVGLIDAELPGDGSSLSVSLRGTGGSGVKLAGLHLTRPRKRPLRPFRFTL
jgi:hypothetical protein